MSQFIEAVERRMLLSVSATTLAGPLTAGTKWTYQEVVGGRADGTSVTTVKGTATFNGKRTIEFDSVKNTATTKVSTKAFMTVDNTKGSLQHGAIMDVSGSGFTQHSTTTFTPGLTALPPSMTAGKVYTFNWNSKVVATVNGQTVPTTLGNATVTMKLGSETLQEVKVPAGTYKAYLVTETLSLTTNGQKRTSTLQIWFAPGVGAVKTVISTPSGPTKVIQLSAFKKV